MSESKSPERPLVEYVGNLRDLVRNVPIPFKLDVRRLHVAGSPLLVWLQQFLHGLSVPPPPYTKRGDWRADVDAGPPGVDRPRPLAYRRQVIPMPRPAFDDGTRIASVNYYPAGGAGLGWHTDSANPGWRVYLALPLSGVRGEFLTHGQAPIVDEPGVALAFRTSRVSPSWHAVRAMGPRLSVGLYCGTRAAELLGLVTL